MVMYYAPHKLYKRVREVVRNSYNEVISKEDAWKFICDCRCDDNTTTHFKTESGSLYVPKYHIVCDIQNISEGDYIRVLNDDGTLRGQGEVYNDPKCNYLDYMSIYV